MAPGTGVMLIKNDCRMVHFCSSKCRKNTVKLGRVPRETRWTKTYALEKKARLGSKHEVRESARKEA